MRPHEWGTRHVRVLAAMFLLGLCVSAGSQDAAKQVTWTQLTWRFDNTAALGGHATKMLGHPKVIETPMGKAIAFDGVDVSVTKRAATVSGYRER